MNRRRSMWIVKVAAVVALVGGFGSVARATILSAGGFPGSRFATGYGVCTVTNAGVRDLVINSVSVLDINGTVLFTAPPESIPPGLTRYHSFQFSAAGHPSACIFDVGTKTGVRAAFVYENGSAVAVIPAQK